MIWKILKLVSFVVSSILKAEVLVSGGVAGGGGAEKRAYVLEEVAAATEFKSFAGGEAAAPEDWIEAIGQLVDAIVTILNLLGILK